MRYIRYAIWLLVIIIGVIFTLMNARSVQIDYYFGSGKVNVFLPLLILIVLMIGAVLGYFAALPRMIKLRHENRRLSRLLHHPNEG
jgi:lipopolysaccharide assembly protein A